MVLYSSVAPISEGVIALQFRLTESFCRILRGRFKVLRWFWIWAVLVAIPNDFIGYDSLDGFERGSWICF